MTDLRDEDDTERQPPGAETARPLGDRQSTGVDTLHELVTERAVPAIEAVVGQAVLRGFVRPADRADLVHESAMRLLIKLRSLREQNPVQTIAQIEEYAYVVVKHAVNDYRSKLDPVRSKLLLRVRYILTHTPGLASWSRERTMVSLAQWGADDAPGTLTPEAVSESVDLADVDGLRSAVQRLLRSAGGPVELQRLVDALAEAGGLHPERFVSSAVLRKEPEPSRVDAVVTSRDYLDWLWSEIEQLPLRQRRALLLNLRAESGDSIVRELVASRLVSFRRVAAALAMESDALAAVWNDLPWLDDRIGSLLGATRQQVINLRKSARDRLARRLGRRRPSRARGGRE